MPTASWPLRTASALARCVTRPRRSDGCRSRHPASTPSSAMPTNGSALLAACRSSPSRSVSRRRCRRCTPGGTPARTRGRRATATRSNSPRMPRASTCRRRGRRSWAPSRPSRCSRRSTRTSCTRTRLVWHPASAPAWDFRRQSARARSSRGPTPTAATSRDSRSAGIVASGRAGRARVAFHVFNDDSDVERRSGGARTLIRTAVHRVRAFRPYSAVSGWMSADSASTCEAWEAAGRVRPNGDSAAVAITAIPTTRASPP